MRAPTALQEARPSPAPGSEQGLPSVFALPQLAASFGAEARGDLLAPREMLAIDPLAALRCLGLAHVPLHAPREPILDVRALATWLGSEAVALCFLGRSPGGQDARPVLALWRNALATAIAARHLAVVRGGCDPEEAYLAGLLHDLRGWWGLLRGLPSAVTVEELERETLLASIPVAFVQRVLRFDLRGTELPRPATAAEAIHLDALAVAHSAGFRHPFAKGKLPQGQDSSTLRTVRDEVRRIVDALTGVTRCLPSAPRADQEVAELSRAIQSLAERREGACVDALRASVVAAAAHSFGFDRAFWLAVPRDGTRAWLRRKFDFLPLEARSVELPCGAAERDAIAMALAGRPVVLRSPAAPLLRTLGSRECVLIALNRNHRVPSILLLDRVLSARPLGDGHELMSAQALAALGEVLYESQILRRRHARAVRFSLTDPLTHVYNRGVGIASLEKEIAKARRTNSALTVLMIDLDNFKRLNDQNGHVVGDLALRRTADVLRRTVRKGDVLCRYGGEEFMAVLPGTSLEEASISATRLFTAVQQEGERLCLPLTISIGCAQMKLEAEESAESLLARADHALYASKAMGRNRFSVDG